jgi:uncharacterized protein (DUF1501 family)
MHPSRRRFVHAAASLASITSRRAAPLALGLAGLGTLAEHAAARAASPYQAVVCVFLHGGSDGQNWIVPLDRDEHSAYRRARGAVALPRQGLMALETPAASEDDRRFGMPASLAPLHALVGRGQAALLANVGPLRQPLSQTDIHKTSHRPPDLYEHDEQALAWQCLAADPAAPGWGGRLGDLLMSANARPVLTTVMPGGDPAFLCGDTVRPLRLAAQGLSGSRPGLDAESRSRQDHDPTAADDVTPPIAPQQLPEGGRFSLAVDPLARQFAAVNRIIGAHAALGLRRQVFMVSAAGFDSHHEQAAVESGRLARVAAAIAWFHAALAGRGLERQVLLFTASEFGRTLAARGDGTGHGWGNHHLLVGGGTRTRPVIGRLPAAGSGRDPLGGGLVPGVAVVELAAGIGRWMGLTEGELRDALPGLAAFDAHAVELT